MTPRDPLTTLGVRAIVQRHITDEETVSFEGVYAGDDEARLAVTNQLALCREHMIQQNERVILVHQKKLEQMDATIAAKGVEVRELERQLADLRGTAKRRGLADARPINGAD